MSDTPSPITTDPAPILFPERLRQWEQEIYSPHASESLRTATPEAQHRIEELCREIEAWRTHLRLHTLACWETQRPLDSLGLEIRSVLLLTLLRTLRTRISPVHLQNLVRFDLWQPEQALNTLEQWRDQEKQAQALPALAPALPSALAPRAWQIALHLQDVPSRKHARIALASALPADAMPQAWEEVERHITGNRDAWELSEILVAFAPHLPRTLLPAAWQHGLDLGWSDGQESLAALAAVMPFDLLNGFWETMMERPPDPLDALVLIALTPYLPVGWLPDALERAQNIPEKWSRCHALLAIALRLPTDQKEPLLQQILAVSQSVEEYMAMLEAERAHNPELTPNLLKMIHWQESFVAQKLFLLLLPHLPSDQRAALIQEALDRTSHQAEWAELRSILPGLAPELTTDQWRQLWRQAQTLTESFAPIFLAQEFGAYLPVDLLPEIWERIRTGEGSTSAQAALAPYLPDAMLEEVWAELQEIGEEWTEERDWIQALQAFAPRLSLQRLQEALDCVPGLAAERRIEALLVIAPYLPAEQRDTLLLRLPLYGAEVAGTEALLSARMNFAPFLPSELHAQMLESLWTGASEWGREQVLENLAPALSPALLQTVWDRALSLPAETERVNLLLLLLRFMPSETPQKLWALVEDLADDWSRSHLISGLAASLSPVQLDRALEIIAQMQDARVRLFTRFHLAEHLPPEARDRELQQIVNALLNLEETQARHNSLIFLIHSLTPDLPEAIRQQVLDAALRLEDEDQRSFAISEFVDCLTPAQREQARAAIHHLEEVEPQIEALMALLPLLPPEQRAEEAEVVLQRLLEHTNRLFAVFHLVRLVPFLHPEILQNALAHLLDALDLQPESSPEHILGGLAPILPATLVPQALEMARRISAFGVQARLAARLPAEERDLEAAEITAQILSIEAPWLRAYRTKEVLSALPIEWLPAILESVPNLPTTQQREEALAALAERIDRDHLPLCLQLLDATAYESYSHAINVLITLMSILQDWGGDALMREITRAIEEGDRWWA